jgi:ubiquinone/menaquinone biosynthesis C-methylase UbiE
MDVADRLSSMLEGNAELMQIEHGIFSLRGAGISGNEYDSAFGAVYDTIACSSLYNRLIWGYPVVEFQRFCLEKLNSSPDGWVLDAGCGSLAFSAKAYAVVTRSVVFLDQSLRMLRLARSRINKLRGGVRGGSVFVLGNVLHLPFKPQSFETVVSLNLIHVCRELPEMLRELKRVLKTGGSLSFTTLIENHRYADAYLRRLGRSGYLVPRTETDLSSAFRAAGLSADYRLIGNMAFISCRRADAFMISL